MDDEEAFIPPQTLNTWIEEAKAAGKFTTDFVDSRCRICSDRVIRDLVNQAISRALTLADIERMLDGYNKALDAEGKPKITRNCLSNHKRKHFDIQSPSGAILRHIQEKWASQSEDDFKDGLGTILNALSYHHTMMVKGYETLLDPNTIIPPEMGAKSADKLHELIKSEQSQYEQAEMLAQYGRFVEGARAFIPQDKWPDFLAALRGDAPIQEAIKAEAVRMIEISDEPDPEEA